MPKNKSAVSQVMDEMAAPLEQNLRGPVNRLFSLIEEIRAMEFSPQDDAIIAAKLRKEVVEIHFGDELASRLDGLKEALDTLRKGLKTLRTGLATIRIK